MAEALDYYTSYFDEGLSETRLLDLGELENGFADGTYGSFISGPWHTGLVEDAGREAGRVRRRAAAGPRRLRPARRSSAVATWRSSRTPTTPTAPGSTCSG